MPRMLVVGYLGYHCFSKHLLCEGDLSQKSIVRSNTLHIIAKRRKRNYSLKSKDFVKAGPSDKAAKIIFSSTYFV